MALDAEELAGRVVCSMARCIDHLRAVEAFTNPSLLKKKKACVRDVKIFAGMKEVGILTEVEAITNGETLKDVPWVDSDALPDKEDDRFLLVHRILLPLLTALGRCYVMLDRIPAPKMIKNSRNQRPPPPPGLLSLQNYTDVAVCIELVVCSGLLPLLETNILLSIQDRVRYMLPKSLAGRIPRAALLWAHQQPLPGDPDAVACELSAVVQVVGQVVLLDRFQPMLLPRHVPDLYAAILQVENRRQGNKTTASPQTFTHLLPHGNNTPCKVNSILQARAFQTLLLQGTKGPLWLRQRVSRLLTDLASRDLPAIVQVFVQAAPQDRSAAGMRLARALVSGSICKEEEEEESSKISYLKSLCQQILDCILEGVYQERGSLSKFLKEGLSPQHEADIHTAWQILDLIPPAVRDEYLLGRFQDSLTPTDSDAALSFHRVVAQFGTLFLTIPPSVDTSEMCKLFLRPLSSDEGGLRLNALDSLLRLASMPSVLQLKTKEDAKVLLRLLRNTFATSKFQTSGTDASVSGTHLFAVALIHALAPVNWDLERNMLQSDSFDETEGRIRVVKDNSAVDMLQLIAQKMEERSRVMATTILLDNTAKKSDDLTTSQLCPIMFEVLLRMYMSKNQKDHLTAPALLLSSNFELVPLVTLPIVCEECQVGSLVSSDDSVEKNGIFDIMMLVFHSTSLGFCGCPLDNSELYSVSHGNLVCNAKLDVAVRVLENVSNIAVLHDPNEHDTTSSPVNDNEEVLLSACSLLLSILVSILELGAEKRSPRDESMLQSFFTVLKPIAELSPDAPESPQHPSLVEIAEVASHAVALLASRKAGRVSGTKHEATDDGSKLNKLSQIENDLVSKEPPIRARGVVGLRHLAMALLETKASSLDSDPTTHAAIQKLLGLSTKALGDKESYVYLAAIHTIAVISEVDTDFVLTQIGKSLVLGLPLDSSSEEECLSNEQRIKLAEALIFSIRRRASIHEYCSVLMDYLLDGTNSDPRNSADKEDAVLIQRQTHDFLLKGVASEKGMDGEDYTQEKDWDDIDMRVKAGGPVFQTEESDAVRASLLNVTAELVAVSRPAVVSRYSSAIIHASIDALRLEASRPVRRAGAFLAKALYDALLREEELFDHGKVTEKDILLAMSLAAGNEDDLHTTLERCFRADDLDDLTTKRLYDPATEARCKEALEARKQADESGILAAGQLALESKRREDENLLARMLKSADPQATSKSKILITEVE